MPVGVVIGLVSALFTALVTEIYCHRCLAHGAFRVRPALAAFFDLYFRTIVGTDPESWAGVHRLHHRYADTPLDPHSPRLRRPFTVLAGSAYLFAVARKRLASNPSGRGPAILVVRGIVVAIYLLTIGPTQVLVALGVHLIFYLGIMGMVNAVGHLYGSKPHADVPGYDLAWAAIPLLGHGYHNSHHAHPAAPRTGPLDSVWPVLRLLAAVRLVELPGAPRPSRACCPSRTTARAAVPAAR